MRATRALGGYQGGSPRAWLLAIARTTFLDATRKRVTTPVDVVPDVGRSDEDVAQTIGRSLGATTVLIHRARAAFREAYAKEGGDV